jgi:hypothetical protein
VETERDSDHAPSDLTELGRRTIVPGNNEFPMRGRASGGPFVEVDLNGDGRPDVVIANTSGNSVIVLLNKSLY